MKRTLTTSEIVDLLLSDENANWTLDGARTLAEWYEELECDSDEEMEFDRVAIRCQWNEFDSFAEIREHYKKSSNEKYTDEEFLEWLEDESTILKLENNRYLVYQF